MNTHWTRPVWLLPLLLAAGCRGPAAAESETTIVGETAVEVAPVTRSRIKSSVELVGTLLPIRATTVVSDVDGIIQSFPLSNRSIQYEEGGQIKSQALGLDLGHAVKAGDVLVQIDPTEFQLAVNLANANLELAKRSLDELNAWRRQEEVDRLEAACNQALATRDRAQADLDRAQSVLAQRVISQGTYDEAKMAYRTAVAALEQAQAAKRLYLAGPTEEELAVAQARVAAAQAEVALRQEKLDKTSIKAKYDGVISDRYVDVGDRVTAMPRVEIMQIVDPRVVFAQVSVPERYQRKIALGAVATISGDGVPEALPARVDLINAKIDPETRTFRLKATIDNRSGALKPGGFVNVELPLETAVDALVVPRDALSFTEGQPAVFVLNQGRVRKAPVEIGISDATRSEIRSGLTEGDQVVVGRTTLLADGTAVRATPWKPGTAGAAANTAANAAANAITPASTPEALP